MKRTRGLLALASMAVSLAAVSAAVAQDKLTIWHYFAVDTQTDVLKAHDKAFTDANPGSEISLVFVPFADMNQKLIAAAAAGTGPDIVIGDGAGSVQLEQAGAIADMTACVDTWANKSELLDAAVRRNGERINGVLPYGNLVALWYNKTLLDKYGIAPPTTTDELEAALKAVTEGGDGGLLLDGNPTFTSAWSSMGLFTSQGVNYPDLDTPATAAAVKRFAGWGNNGWVPRDVTSMDQPTAMNKFLTGNFAFTINGNWEIQHAKNDAKFDYGVTLIPAGSAPGVVYISGETAMLGAYSKNADLACKYLNDTWFSKEGQLRTLAGIGSLPMLNSLQGEDVLKSDPILSQFVAQAGTAVSVGTGNLFVGNATVWGPAISNMWAGNGDPETLANDAVAGVKAALAAN